MADRQDALLEICAEMQPMTVRQVFYQATVRGLVEKAETGYSRVQRALADLRRSGQLPFRWIADNTRWQRRPKTWRSPQEAVASVAQMYRKALWAYQDERVEVWLEKDSLAGVVYDVTDELDVPLMVTRGYASLSFLHSAAEAIKEDGKPATIYHLGDFDPSGQDAATKVEEALRGFAPGVEIAFRRLAVTARQITEWNLPTRPTKASDSRARSFGAISVELDAIPAPTLRSMVRDAIERHLPPEQLQVLMAAEASEREWLKVWAEVANG